MTTKKPDAYIQHLQHLSNTGQTLDAHQTHDLHLFNTGQYGTGTTATKPPASTPPATTPTTPPAASNGAPPDLTYTQIIQQTLASWGLSDLNDLVQSLGKTGASQDQITLQIQQSKEYETRFAGNTERLKNGLSVLSPASYMALESQYRQVMGQLPAGFHDSKQAIDGFIGGDVSPAELSQRVQDANQAYITAPQTARDAWDQYYGTAGAGGAVAAILDTNTAEPLIQQQVTAAGIGGAALSQGLSLTNQSKAIKAAQQGVTLDQARQAYQQIAQRVSTDQSLSGRFSNQATGTFDQGAEEDATLLGDGQAAKRQQALYAQEAAQFSGHGGADSSGSSGNPGSNY